MINKMVSDNIWDQIRIWIKTNVRHHSKIALIGSGGNINKIFKMAGVLESRPLSLIKLNSIYNSLIKMTNEERIINLDLNPDRSDVIIPAAQIFLATFPHPPKASYLLSSILRTGIGASGEILLTSP